MQHSTLTEQARHWAASQPEQVWMRDLSESGATEYTWGAAVAEIDRVAAWLEAEFGHGERMALLSPKSSPLDHGRHGDHSLG